MTRALLLITVVALLVVTAAVARPWYPASDRTAPTKRVYVNCLTFRPRFNDLVFEPRQHPRACDIQGEPEDMANLLRLRQAHWSNWGTAYASATGSALNRPSDGPPPSDPVHVRLFRIRHGCKGGLYYTRAFIRVAKFRGGTLTITAHCQGNPF